MDGRLPPNNIAEIGTGVSYSLAKEGQFVSGAVKRAFG